MLFSFRCSCCHYGADSHIRFAVSVPMLPRSVPVLSEQAWKTGHRGGSAQVLFQRACCQWQGVVALFPQPSLSGCCSHIRAARRANEQRTHVWSTRHSAQTHVLIGCPASTTVITSSTLSYKGRFKLPSQFYCHRNDHRPAI